MAELQLAVPYKTLPNRIAFTTMCVLFPVWSIIAPAALGFFISRAIMYPYAVAFGATIIGCLTLLSIILAGIGMTAIAEDNEIHVSKDGISFPLFLLPKLQYRRARAWSELIGCDIERSTDGSGRERNSLILTFESGAFLGLNLNCCKNADIEQLLLAIELWATRCKRSENLIDYQRSIQNREHGVAQIGYTQMWEEELARRFQATSFIPLEPDTVLQSSRLKIVRQLAFGGLSALYLAQENKRDLVVLKEAVIPPSADSATRAEAEKHLLREADMLSRVKHPNIARVLDHFVEDGRHYLMLEYINGQDLRQYVKQNGPVKQEVAVEWGIKILDILHTLHTQHPPILHRDLTPENLVLTKETIMLIDFGAANQFIGTATGTVVGKQAYIPPEQLRGKSVTESDIYSFGGTMYFLLTGEDPMPLSISHPASMNNQIDKELDQIVATCSAFESKERYSDATVVAGRLAEVLGRLNQNVEHVGVMSG